MPVSAAAGLPGLAAGYLLRATVVLILALAAAAAARRRPAALRHFILSSALIGLLLLPFLSRAPVGWRSPLLPRWMAAPAERAEAPGTGAALAGERRDAAAEEADGASRKTPVETLLSGTSAPLAAPEPGPAAASAASTPAGTMSGSETGEPERPAPATATAPDRGKEGPSALGTAVAVLWSAGLALLVLRLAVGLAGAVRLSAEGTHLSGSAWKALIERFLALVSLRRPVRLKSHPEVLVPLTWGWRRPVVLLPADADGWSEEQRSSALFHELSHVKRADFLVMLLVRTSLAVFWWNPLCWVVYRRLLREQETACDELVLRAGIRPSSYAASLLSFRRSAGSHWNPSAALLGMLGRSSFQERLAAILKQKLVLMEVKMKTKIMLAAVLVLAVAFVGTARPVREDAAEGAATVLAETALPAPLSFDGAASGPVQETKAEREKAQTAEKAKEAEKAKAAEKAKQAGKASVGKTIVISPISAEGKPVEIVITEGDEVKTLVIEKPLTITRKEGGQALVLSLDGKEIQVLEGEPLRIEIKGGDLRLAEEGRPVRIVEGKELAKTQEIVTKDGVIYLKSRPEGGRAFSLAKTVEGGEVKIVLEPHVEGRPTIVFHGDANPKVAVEASPEVFVKMRKDVKEGENWVHVGPGKEGQAVKIVKEGEPAVGWVAKDGKSFSVRHFGDTDMLEKVRALREQVQAVKAKKLDLSALEESLAKLEAELDESPGAFKIVKRIGEDEAVSRTGVWAVEKGKASGQRGATVMVGIGDKNDRAINMVFTGRDGEEGRADYERALAQLKKELPEGYKILEQKYDAEKGTMSFKVEAPEGKTTDQTLIRKIVDSLKETIKAGK